MKKRTHMNNKDVAVDLSYLVYILRKSIFSKYINNLTVQTFKEINEKHCTIIKQNSLWRYQTKMSSSLDTRPECPRELHYEEQRLWVFVNEPLSVVLVHCQPIGHTKSSPPVLCRTPSSSNHTQLLCRSMCWIQTASR